ncbi:hypothetical protein [Haloglycomyces albus]|uniref:hypothetical protein n=1 Tax=Haloglycomyces albus TaxID=526067 RepID=UPI00046C9AD6|nr:hypothetical protein [Haloglycomyces albus]
MPINYLPSEALDIGTLRHDGDDWRICLDLSAKTAYLLPPQRKEAEQQRCERAPVAIAYCHVWTRPTVVLYNERLYLRARHNETWLPELSDRIAWSIRPYLSTDDD